jgi:hypothetical protein
MEENPSANPDTSYGPTHIMKMWIIAIQMTMIPMIANHLLRETPQEARDMFRGKQSYLSLYNSDHDLVKESGHPPLRGASDHNLYLVKERSAHPSCSARHPPGGGASYLSREISLTNLQVRLSRRIRILLKGRRTNPILLDFSARRRRRGTRPPMAFVSRASLGSRAVKLGIEKPRRREEPDELEKYQE